MARLPMFPLGRVLFPHMVLPLHVFEERYRELVRRVRDDGGEFGVVLIERGSEVGGGDTRHDVGTVARVVEVEELSDGRFVLVTVGTRRVRVIRWLPDDPHPWAEVEDAVDPPAGEEAADLRVEVGVRLRRVLGLLLEARPDLDRGDLDVDELELHPDAEIASYQACALAPVGSFDAQRLLEAGTHRDRLRTLLDLLDDAEELLRSS